MKPMLFASLALVLVACGESHPGGGMEDAQIVFDLDGARIDGGPPDAGPSTVGAACGLSGDCMGAANMCLADPVFLPGGYCTLDCAGGGACPTGSTCVMIGRAEAYCFQDCTPGATPRQCRAGYGCANDPMIPPVCLGGCSDDTDCPTGLNCDPSGGPTASGACYDPASTYGEACAADANCPMGAACLTEADNNWPGGACVAIVGCDVAADSGCPAGTRCIPGGFRGTGICVESCAVASDCRSAYDCRAPATLPGRTVCMPACATDADCTVAGNVCNPSIGTCAPAFSSTLLGGACSRFMGGCDGGTCLSENGSGYPGGSCSYRGCTVGMDSTCPTGGSCMPTADGINQCLEGCTSTADCSRAAEGYACRPVDWSGATSSSLACQPACTSDAQCTLAMFTGAVCNPGTGTCGPAFAGTVGGMCTASSGTGGCAGGTCITSWPNGTCAAPGCRLTGTGPAYTCPTGSVCIDDATGDPAIGYCVASCLVGAAGGCRTDGYACIALPGSTTDGYCGPT